jgi:hypothetical protein
MSGIRDHRAEALAYMEGHKIIKIFDLLGVKLAEQVKELIPSPLQLYLMQIIVPFYFLFVFI